MNIARGVLLSLVLASGLQAGPAGAVTISAGTTTFNLDFTSSKPYFAVGSLLNGHGLAAGASLTFRECPDFDGGGNCNGASVGGPTTVFGMALDNNEPGFLDGLFSVQLILDTGSVDIDSLVATVRNENGGIIASQTLIPRAVPEPATLALLSLGLAGIGFSRRKH